MAISGIAIPVSYHPCQVTACHTKIGHQSMNSTGTQSSDYKLWLDNMIWYQTDSSSNDHQGNKPDWWEHNQPIDPGPDQTGMVHNTIKDDIIIWKCLPDYWPFVRGIHQSLVDSPHKGPVMQRFDVLFVVSLNNLPLISKTMTLMWRHCSVLMTEIATQSNWWRIRFAYKEWSQNIAGLFESYDSFKR